jgi:TRAP transporter 4TM/12TM fusion protein
MTGIADIRGRLIAVIAIGMSAFHLYTGAAGIYTVPIQNGVHLAFAMALILLVRPTEPFSFRGGALAAGTYDVLITLAAALPLAYRLANNEYLTAGRFIFVTPLTPLELVFGLAFIVAVLDLCRRQTGWPLVAIVLVFLAYPSFSSLPGIFGHRPYSLSIQLDTQYMSLAGIFSVPLTASAGYIAPFIIFGAFLERSGLGRFVIDFSIGLVGPFRGGPAKVAVIASALTGSISGSAPANVLTTGILTIPMMKRLGYPAYMAGAIEAAASTGGVLMPPVMGTIAFIMAQFTGVPYITIALYALIPAGLYFFGVFLTVHWSAVHHGLSGIPRSELPDWRQNMLRRGHLMIPLFLLIYLMVAGYSPQLSVTYSTAAVVIVSWLRRETRMGLHDIIAAMENGAKGALIVAIATAAAGMIVGVFELTAIGLKFAQAATGAVNFLIVGMIVTMIVSIVLGMGVPPSVSYIVQVAVTIPMLQFFLTDDGMVKATAVIVSHFFVMYYSALAVLTPPDALASIAASGVAGSPFMKTAIHATRVAFVAFIVPFMFVYRPALLTFGTGWDIATAIGFAVLGIAVLSMALEGYSLRRLNPLERAVAFVTGGALIVPTALADIIGLVGLGVFIAMQWFPIGTRKPAVAALAQDEPSAGQARPEDD